MWGVSHTGTAAEEDHDSFCRLQTPPDGLASSFEVQWEPQASGCNYLRMTVVG